jgi:hypothetical protein
MWHGPQKLLFISCVQLANGLQRTPQQLVIIQKGNMKLKLKTFLYQILVLSFSH